MKILWMSMVFTVASTPSTPSTSSIPPPVLVCVNGGELLSSVCICPPHWSGPTCSEENFCRETTMEFMGRTFKFPSTTVGWFAYSVESCPETSVSAGTPEVSVLCSNQSGIPTFERPLQILQCNITLNDLKNVGSPADCLVLANNVQILTSRPEQLSPDNITTAANIANTLLYSANMNQAIAVAAAATISHLLNSSIPDRGVNTKEANATQRLPLSLQYLFFSGRKLNIFQPNLVLQTAQIPTHIHAVQFTSLAGTTDSFVGDRVQLTGSTSDVPLIGTGASDLILFLKLGPTPEGGSQQNPFLGIVLFQNDHFFPSAQYRTLKNLSSPVRVVGVRVWSQGSVQIFVPEQVQLLMRNTSRLNGKVHPDPSLYSLDDYACVFWDYSTKDWSTVGSSKNQTEDGLLRCVWNHTTLATTFATNPGGVNFAILMSYRTVLPASTPSTPSTSSIPPPVLVCVNGGELLSSVCICPPHWSGPTCSEENFCRENTTEFMGRTFKFPNTTVGWFAYSVESCPETSVSAGTPVVSVLCSNQSGIPTFERPLQILQCNITLNDLDQNVSSPADLLILASNVQILTSRPEQLSPDNITTAANIANFLLTNITNSLLLSPKINEKIAVAAAATISQLLNSSIPDRGVNATEADATQRLAQTLEQFSLNSSLKLNIVQPNLVLKSAQIPTHIHAVQFTSLAGITDSFVGDRVQLNINTSDVTMGTGASSDLILFLKLPEGRSQQNSSVGIVLYQNDRFFPSAQYRTLKNLSSPVRVVSASLGQPNRPVVPEQVQLLIRNTSRLNGKVHPDPSLYSLYDYACVSWDYSTKDWSTTGCYKNQTEDGLLRCVCNHTTNFAILMSYRMKYEYADALTYITYLGLAFSIAGLSITVVHQIHIRKSRMSSNITIVMVSICVSMLIFIIVFLAGIDNNSRQNDLPVKVNDTKQNVVMGSDVHVERDHGSCTAVAALLQYFLLATFVWNSVYATQLLVLIAMHQTSLPPHATALSVATGWGIPAAMVSLSLAVCYRPSNPLGFRREDFCWLAATDATTGSFDFGKPMFWAFLLPVGVVLVYNTAVFLYFIYLSCKKQPDLTSTQSNSLKKKLLSSLSMAILLGISWIMGYLMLVTTGTAHIIFNILFCVVTTTQGFQIFVLFTARTSSFRSSVSSVFLLLSCLIHSPSKRYVSAEGLDLNVEQSL